MSETLFNALVIARQATAHNYGQTVFDYRRFADNYHFIRMSSWPRAREATVALEQAGYEVQHRNNLVIVRTA